MTPQQQRIIKNMLYKDISWETHHPKTQLQKHALSLLTGFLQSFDWNDAKDSLQSPSSVADKFPENEESIKRTVRTIEFLITEILWTETMLAVS
jgi:hypothetical protein